MFKTVRDKQGITGRYGKSDAGKRQRGFSLIEVIAVTVILGVMATMLLPSVNGAGSKARNAKLKNDLATLDQAIATYKLEKGNLPASLTDLVPDYVAKNKGFKDAKENEFTYSASGATYSLSGSDTEGNTVSSNGSTSAGANG